MLAIAGLAVIGWSFQKRPDASAEPVGLFTSLPVMWGEGSDVAQLLAAGQQAHRVRRALVEVGPIVPQDTLDGLGPKLHRLVIAQPRPLSPLENVALDNWLRAGGELLLFADPMLTEPSAFALGDPRRPQDIVLLSPILGRWGLELMFDDRQPAGVRSVALGDTAVPVDLAGTWQTTAPNCRVEGNGVLVTCRIGKGRLVALADAEVMSAKDADRSREPALAALFRRAFAQP